MLTIIPRVVDPLTNWVASLVKWIVLVLAFVNCYEVVMRYVFGKPTIWAYDISYMLGGSFFVLGIGYALLTKAHVRVDVVYIHWSRKTQALLDVILSLLLFFPAFSVLLYKLIPWVIRSWERQEKASGSFWLPPIYPLKTIILIAVALLLLQGLSELCKDLKVLTAKEQETAE
ncbi:TRAP transporter small permease subunit [Pusillimonas sp.]|uniref:TRAP transporter small permease subunit n=1 Tax=Pusillimonas sp. TaxID=3040095 RepID=UPI0037CA04E7